MNDRELLLLSAKAAGIKHDQRISYGIWIPEGSELKREWNPLQDDGDALRLLSQLNLSLRFYSEPDGAVVIVSAEYDTQKDISHAETVGKDSAQAVRVAIVGAASQLGELKP